jgi:hypothetical protein
MQSIIIRIYKKGGKMDFSDIRETQIHTRTNELLVTCSSSFKAGTAIEQSKKCKSAK